MSQNDGGLELHHLLGEHLGPLRRHSERVVTESEHAPLGADDIDEGKRLPLADTAHFLKRDARPLLVQQMALIRLPMGEPDYFHRTTGAHVPDESAAGSRAKIGGMGANHHEPRMVVYLHIPFGLPCTRGV